jgi:DNA replication protein DnaC
MEKEKKQTEIDANTTPLKELILKDYPDFLDNIDENVKLFAREIRKELRDEGHVVIGVTGYPGVGKSNITAILGMLIDENYNFKGNICYIPTSKQIESQYYGLKMHSFLHIDEASRGLHKHKWQDKIQQKLNELYDTEREGHFLCTAFIMPRFQNFTENFRNFMIKYWIHVPVKGLALFYKKDEDKDAKDPWHIDENYKSKRHRWRGKRVFERDLPNIVRAEQTTDCYWFYSKIPAVPKEIWMHYQELKALSRKEAREQSIPDVEGYHDRRNREKRERHMRIAELKQQGKTNVEIGVLLGCSPITISRSLKEIEVERQMAGKAPLEPLPHSPSSDKYIFNKI